VGHLKDQIARRKRCLKSFLVNGKVDWVKRIGPKKRVREIHAQKISNPSGKIRIGRQFFIDTGIRLQVGTT